MRWPITFIALSLLLFCSLHSQCQDTTNYVYQDSSILYPESDEKAVVSAPGEEVAGETTTAVFIDTSLIKNQLTIPGDSVRAIKNLKPFAYAKILDSLLKDYQDKQRAENTVKEEPSWLDLFFAAQLTQFFFWALAILFIGFIVYKIFFAEGFFQRSTSKSNVTVVAEDDKNVSKSTDYDRLLAQAAGNKNYRLAVRYLYLRTLQKLTAAGTINFAVDKTNAAYLRELSGKPYKNEFASLTLNYEYIWYGGFAIDEAAFITLESRFKQLNTRL